VWVELHQGYSDDVDHITAILGDLSWAADHLYEKQPDLALAIRSERSNLLDEFISRPAEPPRRRPEFEQHIRVILSFLQDELSEKKRRHVSPLR